MKRKGLSGLDVMKGLRRVRSLKMHSLSLSVVALCLTLAALPAVADTLYSDGPINGTTDGWTINFGFVVSDRFTATGLANGLTFAAWLFPGDVLETAEVMITSDELGGTTYLDEVVNFTQSNCSGNQYGYNVCLESGSFTATNLNGTYWLNLGNAVVNNGDPVYWDENSGPSAASENILGTLPAEAFTIVGGTTSTTSVPEPSTVLLFGSGILGLANLVRRKLR